MRILIVCDTQMAARDEAHRSCGPNVTLRMFHDAEVTKDDTVVVYASVYDWHDIHKIRGTRFDMVIEDCSFNPQRRHDRARMLNEVRAQVLR